MRRSWLAALAPFAALLSTACGIQAEGYGVDGAFERTITLTAPAEVSVVSRSGSIRVTAGPSDRVHIAAHIRAFGSLVYAASDQVQQIESAPPIRQDGRTLTIGDIDDPMLRSNVRISYEVTVPPDARVRTSSRSGTQTITALRGPLDALSRSGNIRVDDATGPVRLGSRSGDVVVEGAPSGPWDIETRSGDVRLRVPSTAAFDVDIETRSGSIRAAREFESAGTLGRNGFRGRVRGGGAAIVVGTRSGSISID
jgi:hypothetical protein